MHSPEKLNRIKQLIDENHIETVIVGFPDHYGRFVGKRFDAEFFKESVAIDGSHACDYLMTTDMEMEPVSGYSFANWELGYGDFHMVPDLSTFRILSWQESTACVIADLYDDQSHQMIDVAPRTILKKQIDIARSMGFDCMTASELEFYIFKNSYREAHQLKYSNLESSGWYLEDYHILQGTRVEPLLSKARKHLKQSGVPVENSKGEWGLGQHELNVRYSDALQMADRHLIFKQCLKELADSEEMSVSFMAKYHENQAGSSCHIHMSLWQKEENVFPGKNKYGTIKASDAFGWFLGGWIAHAYDIMPFYAPNINSYKRYVDGSWAPTRLAWSRDNRTAGFRVVGQGKSLRIECRIPGADCNPYLAFAALLASGLDGIKQKIQPPDIFIGDIYAANELPRVPYTLAQAIPAFEASPFARRAFGKEVVEHYGHFFKKEQEAFDQSVTDWERKRYFERI